MCRWRAQTNCCTCVCARHLPCRSGSSLGSFVSRGGKRVSTNLDFIVSCAQTNRCTCVCARHLPCRSGSSVGSFVSRGGKRVSTNLDFIVSCVDRAHKPTAVRVSVHAISLAAAEVP